MQSVHHVVMATYKRLINPGRLQYRQFGGSFHVLPTDPVGHKADIAIYEAHLVVALSNFGRSGSRWADLQCSQCRKGMRCRHSRNAGPIPKKEVAASSGAQAWLR